MSQKNLLAASINNAIMLHINPSVNTNFNCTDCPDRAMCVLVTGATGFLGSAVVEQLQLKGIKVVTVGRRPAGMALSPNYHQVDLASKTLEESILVGVDGIIHCAGLAHQFGSRRSSGDQFDRINVDITERLVRKAIQCGISRFVLVSSISVYGTCFPIKSETDECHPATAYGRSKLAAERIMFELAGGSDMEVMALRMATLYGKNDPGNVARLARSMQRPFTLLVGSGRNVKSLLHVADAGRACVTAIAATRSVVPRQVNQVFNVTAQPVTMRRVVEILSTAMERRIPWSLPSSFVLRVCKLMVIMCVNLGPAVRLQLTIQKWLSDDTVDGERFNRAYSFETIVGLNEGLEEEVRWLQSAPTRIERAKRVLDIVLATIALIVFCLPLFVVAFCVKATSSGPVFYWSNRVGQNNRIFPMAKFRSMRTDAPQLATHLLSDSKNWITPVGRLLRKTSLDELPQLWNVLRGDMSFVGPRPALYNQDDLISLRTVRGIDALMPGITGWAQLNGRDELAISEKVEFDTVYLHTRSICFDIRIIFHTIWKAVRREGVQQADEMEVDGASACARRCIIWPSEKLWIVATVRTLTAAAIARESLLCYGEPIGLVCVSDLYEAALTAQELAWDVFLVGSEDTGMNLQSNTILLTSELDDLMPTSMRSRLTAHSETIVRKARTYWFDDAVSFGDGPVR